MAVIHFAPLQGYTDSVYREAHTRVFGGVDTYYTPFVRIEKGGLKVKFTIGWGRSYLKYISILIEQLYKTVREIMEMLLRNCLFFVDLSKIIQSLFIRAWMSNV